MASHSYREYIRIKTIDFGKRVRSHSSYLANTVELCFYNTLGFFVLFCFFFNTLGSFFP